MPRSSTISCLERARLREPSFALARLAGARVWDASFENANFSSANVEALDWTPPESSAIERLADLVAAFRPVPQPTDLFSVDAIPSDAGVWCGPDARAAACVPELERYLDTVVRAACESEDVAFALGLRSDGYYGGRLASALLAADCPGVASLPDWLQEDLENAALLVDQFSPDPG